MDKSRFSLGIVSQENFKYADQAVYKEELGLVTFVYYIIDESSAGIMSHQSCKIQGIDKEELFEIARQNTIEAGFSCTSFNDLNFIGEVVENPFHVLTSRIFCAGAVVMLIPEIMDQVVETMGNNFIILPSSKHEVLLAQKKPPYEATPAEYLRDMRGLVKAVNSSNALEPEDVLSNEVFAYDAQNHKLKFAEASDI